MPELAEGLVHSIIILEAKIVGFQVQYFCCTGHIELYVFGCPRSGLFGQFIQIRVFHHEPLLHGCLVAGYSTLATVRGICNNSAMLLVQVDAINKHCSLNCTAVQ
jgi:hypothetical protein